MVADLEPDILESKVKWALESMANNKASRGDGIPVELFKILKYSMTLLRCYTQYANKFGKLSSGQRIRNDRSTPKSQRRAVAKNDPAAGGSMTLNSEAGLALHPGYREMGPRDFRWEGKARVFKGPSPSGTPSSFLAPVQERKLPYYWVQLEPSGSGEGKNIVHRDDERRTAEQ